MCLIKIWKDYKFELAEVWACMPSISSHILYYKNFLSYTFKINSVLKVNQVTIQIKNHHAFFIQENSQS